METLKYLSPEQIAALSTEKLQVILQAEKHRDFDGDLAYMRIFFKDRCKMKYEIEKNSYGNSDTSLIYSDSEAERIRTLAVKYSKQKFYVLCEPNKTKDAFQYRNFELLTEEEMLAKCPLIEELNWKISLSGYLDYGFHNGKTPNSEDGTRKIFFNIPNLILVDPMALRIYELMKNFISIPKKELISDV